MSALAKCSSCDRPTPRHFLDEKGRCIPCSMADYPTWAETMQRIEAELREWHEYRALMEGKGHD